MYKNNNIRNLIRIIINEALEDGYSHAGVDGGVSPLMQNVKTHRSIDVDTICPRREFQEYHCMEEKERDAFLRRMDIDHPGSSQEFLEDYEEAVKSGKHEQCFYCYVRRGRDINFNAKEELDVTEYNHDVLRLHKSMIERLNSMGGIRLFGSSDYKPRKYMEYKEILDDCYKVGLKVKAITKVTKFVRDFVDHPAINIIQLSVDAYGKGVDHKEAIKLRVEYPDKVRIRMAVIELVNLLNPIVKFVDIFTFFHGVGSLEYGGKVIKPFKPKDIDAIRGGTYDMGVHQDLSVGEIEKILGVMKKMQLKNKTCCVGGHCSMCKLKCSEKKCSIA